MANLVSLTEYMERFGTEDACWQHLRQARWGEDGFECPRCHETEHWGFIETRKLFQCHECGYQCSITAGTIMQDTKLALTTWFLAARLVLTMKKGISSHELARQLDISQDAAWYLIQRLSCVVKRAYGRQLFGLVEVDETYVGGKRSQEEGSGRSHSRASVLGFVESKDNSAGNLVLHHVPDVSSTSIDPQLEAHVDKETAVVKTDGWLAYWSLAERTGFEHEMVKMDHLDVPAHEIFPWVHIVWSNLKRVIRGVHTKASRAQLQDYLDLFAFRFNHREDLQAGVEEGVVGLVSSKPVTREALKGGELARAY